jgi:hypothetical protein
MANEPEEKPRGLWGVMQRQSDGPLTEAPPREQLPGITPQEAEEVEFEAVETERKPSSSSPGKGLWAMMGVKSAPAITPELEPSSEEEHATPAPAWFRGKVESEAPAVGRSQEPEVRLEMFVEIPASEPKVTTRPVPRTQPASFVVARVETPAQAKISHLAVKTGRSRGAMISFLVGLFAIPMTLLAMRPEFWTRIPATCLGFGALVLGLISFNEVGRSRGQQKGSRLAMLGMILGTIAMFLGPLVIAPWSEGQNKAGVRHITQSHLEEIGTALSKYHRDHDRFPPGGTYRVEETGESTALHSWMTELLPYLDAEQVYQEIRLNDPWSEPLNKPAFAKKIPAFLAGGVEQTHNQAGYGLSHFAGVGGQVQIGTGPTANAGIFDRGSNLSRKDITDGESQTLIAGEIPEGYRPWGEPGNWRSIGEGLNKDTTSFGNAQGTGAMFLKADGSVQFYSNSVAADVLKRLSSRDGDDNRMIPDKFR